MTKHMVRFTAYLSHVSTSGKLVTLWKALAWNLSSLVVECIVVEELQSSLSPWLRDPRLPDVDVSMTWLGRTACFEFSCKDGLDEPSAKGYTIKDDSQGQLIQHNKEINKSSICNVCFQVKIKQYTQQKCFHINSDSSYWQVFAVTGKAFFCCGYLLGACFLTEGEILVGFFLWLLGQI